MGRHFFFTRMALSPPLDKRNTRDKAQGFRITSERYIGELGVRCLSTLNKGQDSKQQSHIAHRSDQYRFAFGPILVDVETTIGSLIDHYWFVCCTTIGSPSKRIVVYILHLFYLVYALLLVANLPA